MTLQDDDDVGPMPLAAPVKKKQRSTRVNVALEHEQLYLDLLPDADMYETSLMHRDVVHFVVMTK